jgi:hypothetical protein
VDGITVNIHVPQLKIKDDPESILLYLQQVEVRLIIIIIVIIIIIILNIYAILDESS